MFLIKCLVLPVFFCARMCPGAAVHAGLEADSCLQAAGGPTSVFVRLWGRWRRLRLFHRIGFSVTVVREK